MSAPADLSSLHRALDIAHTIAGSANPKRLAVAAATNDIVDLACAAVALERVAALAAEFLIAQDAALDLTEVPLDTPEKRIASDAADTAADASREALTAALVGYGYLTIQEQEKTDGSAS